MDEDGRRQEKKIELYATNSVAYTQNTSYLNTQ
jgi:hypothetical protein